MPIKKDHKFSAWAEIDLKAIRHNYREIKRLAFNQFVQDFPLKRKRQARKFPDILTVIKADAYGHGMLEVASALSRLGANFFGVSDVAEGIILRNKGIKKPVLLFESTLPSCAQQVVDYHLMPTVCTLGLAKALNTYAKSANRKVDIHVKVDTGMGRLGVWHQEAREFVSQILRFPHLSIKGIYTHFPVADTDASFTKNQINLLFQLVTGLDKHAKIVPYIHAANSMGLGGYKTRILNLTRPGLMLYGLYPSAKLRKKIFLQPAMRVKARVIFVKRIVRGRGISYGHTFIAKKDMTVATLPIGYNDGYLRCLSNRSSVLIDGKRCPVIGRVTMDQVMVDVTKVKSVKLGREAVLLGTQKNANISADELARQADTINYEIVCSLGNRLPRMYKS